MGRGLENWIQRPLVNAFMSKIGSCNGCSCRLSSFVDTDPVRMRAGRCEVNVGYITPEEIRARLVVVSIRVTAAPSGMTILLFSWLEK